MSQYVVGLTGGIGSGKSTVADLFVELGAGLVDTDAIARKLTLADGAAMLMLAAEFGPEIVAPDGALDRAVMRQLAFADPSARSRLENILHPLIRQIATERCRAATEPYVILAVPLLVESGAYREHYDRVVVVDCPESLQIARVMARNGLSVDEVEAIMAVQATRQQRLLAANDIVVNDADKAKIVGQVKVLHSNYLVLLAKKLKACC
jgi:dephospho-CoA kinase